MTVIEVFPLPWLNLLLALGGVLGLAYIFACLFLLFRQNRFIFRPSTIVKATPAALNINYQEVWLSAPTASGKKNQINCWWIPSATPNAKVWLYLHGNALNMGANLKRAEQFHQLGFSCLMLDYRGYGKSQGKFPTEFSIYEDVEIAWNYLTQVRQIPLEQILLYGHSLGGAIAIELAAKHPEVSGLVVESSFTSILSMVNYTKRFQLFPINFLLHQRFDSLSKVQRLQMPVLFLHGNADEFVPAYMSQTLFDATSEPKKLLLVPEAGHQDAIELAGAEFVHGLQWLIEQAQARPLELAQHG
ncbi:MAG: alpha/beta hydrolase [Symploca sp. SIO2G7]|nr:alpha/beta hydrolase [Symploca sp. SIO2G7]